MGRTLSPDNEGMETPFGQARALVEGQAGHSAPTMRGWKHILRECAGSLGFRPDTQPRQ